MRDRPNPTSGMRLAERVAGMNTKYQFSLGLLAVAGLMLWACNETTDEPGGVGNAAGQPAGGEAAMAGQGGDATQVVVGGAGGAGGTNEPNCEPLSIETTCGSCPKSPDDFDLKKNCGTDPYGGELGVTRYTSDCGGVLVDVWGDKHDGFSYYSSRYSFDAQGTLVGYSFGTDVADECADVGTVCAPLGKPESLCPEGGAGGQGGAGGAAGGKELAAGQGGIGSQ